MANLAENWAMGVVKCDSCGYEWNVSVSDLPQISDAVAAIVTGAKDFQIFCPECGHFPCAMIEISGE